VTDRLLAQAFTPASGRYAELARRIQTRTVLELAATSRAATVSPAARAEIAQRLVELAAKLQARPGADPSERAHRLTLAALLQDKEELARVLAEPRRRPKAPPGMPIGSDED
jgi:enoyl-CoA hydratase/carnithine racemase